MISGNDAQRIAENFVKAHPSSFRYKCVSMRFREGEWAIVFAVFAPEGHEIDGPVVVLVDADTGKPRFLPGL